MDTNYSGFIGCNFPEETKVVEDYINDWYERNDMGGHHFSAERNSRMYFFANVSHWMMKLIAKHQDFWCDNARYHSIIQLLSNVHELACYQWVPNELINSAVLDLCHMVNEYKEEL